MRGRAFGYNSLGWTIGAMLGIVLGGVIATFVGWRYIFLINVPIGIVAVVIGLRYLRDSARVNARMDIGGMILFGVSLAFLSFGGVDFASGGPSTINLIITIVGALLLPLFVLYEIKNKSPMIDFKLFKDKVLRYSIMAPFFLSLGYLAVVFLVTMYLQGVRGLTPLNASILLVPGYVVGSFLGPLMGRLSDKYGARLISTLGVVFLGVAVLVYLTLQKDTSLYVVLLGSGLSGIGISMFFPANSSAVMASAKPGSYGSVSGLLRTVQNVGILGSFVLAITVAAASIPRAVAFQIFIGTTNLTGGLSQAFISGIDSALYVSLIMLTIAGVLSLIRGKETRSD